MNKLLFGLGFLLLLFMCWAGRTTPQSPNASRRQPAAGCPHAASSGGAVSSICQPQDARSPLPTEAPEAAGAGG
ncbi:hypothetical protein Q5H93_05085 [Hymenobacter sp. ASUV-10]|uniref:Secreted protein n=1 Tax=Hymenobacter aranciens TaxID=3063996 RepID=A0ABT9B7C1_9BACT|nr:hypothetical protein [Hymenobacter sp. ASUV-10]MDO7874098.1 hypothetical protein [Hymenobacter sp. ASUV-10]